MINILTNDTSTDGKGRLIPGSQLDLYFRPVMEALEKLGAEYLVSRQPQHMMVGVYPNDLDRYQSGLRKIHRIRVGVSHGIASKGYIASKHAQYHHIVVPGHMHAAEAYAMGARTNKVHILGYPKLDPLFQGKVDGSGLWTTDDRVRVLYAPTHGGGSERFPEGNKDAPGAKATSWWFRNEVMSLLDPDVFQVVLAPHPRHAPGRQATFAQYVGAQVVIADGGSTMYEAMALGKPIVLPSWMTRKQNVERASLYRGGTLEAKLYSREIGYHAESPRELPGLVKEAMESGLRPKDVDFTQKVFPSHLRGRSGELWAKFFIELTEGKHALGLTRRRRGTIPV